MILAGIGDYTRPWQLPLIALYVGLWLIGGAYLTRWALRRFGQLPKSKSPIGRAAKINALAGGAALAAAGIVILFFLALGGKYGQQRLTVIIGVICAPFVMVGMSWLVHLVVLDFPTDVAARLTASTAVPLFLVLAMIGTAAFVPAWYLRQAEKKEAYCKVNLLTLGPGLHAYARRFPGNEPAELQVLVQTGFVEAKHLACPGRPEEGLGYLYVPSRMVSSESQKIWLSDRRGNHGRGRWVLFNDRRILFLSEEEFQALLALPENAAMAKLAAADR